MSEEWRKSVTVMPPNAVVLQQNVHTDKLESNL